MKTISSRFLKGALAILLVVVMLFGSTISGFAAVVDNADTSANVDVAETEATVTFTSDDVLFFNMKAVSWWTAGTNGNGNFAYFFNNSTNKNAWSAHAVNYSGDIYYVKIPAGTWEGVILTRNNTSTAPSWDNKWNQTGNISLSSTSNYISKFSENSTSATWSTQKPASAGSLTASSTSVDVGDPVTLTPNLTSNTTYNEIKSTSYSINPSSGATISSNNFTASAAGTYTVTATITYNPRGYSNLTSTVTASKTITVTEPVYYYDVTYNANGGSGGPTNATDIEGGTSYTIPTTEPTYSGYEFLYWKAGDGAQYQPGASFTVNSDVTLTAQWAKIHTVTYNANGGSGAPANGSVVNGNNYVISSTVPTRTNYNFTGWKDGSGTTYAAGDTISTVTGDITLTAQWELAGVCAPEMAGLTLNIGGTDELNATTNNFCEDAPNSTFTYSIVDGSNYISLSGNIVTAKAAGTAHVKATCSCGETVTCAVVVNAPTVDADDITSLDVNGTVTLSNSDLTITNAPTSYTVTYSTDSNYFSVTEGGIITGIKPGTGAVNISMKYNGTQVATGTFNVTVDAPTCSINPPEVNLIVGQTMTTGFVTTSTPAAQSVTLASAEPAKASISGTKVTALAEAEQGVTITATFKYNDNYSATATAEVIIAAPEITASPASVALEYGDGSTATSKTVTLDPNTEDGNSTGDTITVSSDNTNVATATLSGTTLTINATGLGSTTVKAKFHDATVEIPVTVSQYDPYVYLYVTDNNSWGSMYLYSWKGSNTVVTPITTSMIYIGKNGDGNNIFAYRFSKTNLPENIILAKNSSWGSQTADTAINWNNTNHRALYFASNSDRSTMNDWTSDCMIVRPTVSVADVVVPVAGTETATATVENGGVVYWTMADTNTATVANVTTATATVTGATPGDTTISARAFVDTANSSIKTLPTNYATDTACWPFISTEATATVTVGSVDYDITAAASYSDDGDAYNDGTTGGTVSITVDGEDLGTSAAVAHGNDYTLTATAATNYRFVGWYNGDELVDTKASYTVESAKAAADYTAKFVKTHKVTVNFTEGIELIEFNNVSYNESFDNITVDAGATITVYASPATNYAFKDWTVVGADVADNTTAILTIANVQDSITLTANAVPVYTATATAQTNKYHGTYGGTVTIDGQSSPVQYKNGETVTFEAHNNANYYFDGWYTDAEFTNRVSTDAEYQATMTADGITLYALFVKNFYLTSSADERLATFVYNVADNSYSVTADFADHFTITSNDNNDVNATDVNVTGGTHTGCTVAGHYTSYQVTPDTENYDITAPVTYTLTPDMVSGVADGTYTMNIALSDAEKVEISVNGTKVAEKAIGSTFSYEITAPDGQYLSSATITPAVPFEIVDGWIEFTVPETNVNIVPAFTNYSYVELSDSTGITATGLKTGYKAGEPVSITLSPASEATTIAGVVADNNSAVITQNGDNWTITIASMPADTTITLTPTVDAKFVMDYGMYAIGNYGSGYATYGTVSMKIGDTALAKGGYAAPTDTVSYTATPNANFIFDGWYSNESCEKSQLISRDTTYEVSPTADTTVYALFVPKHYIAEDQANVNVHSEMTYDPETRSFKYSSSTIAKGAWFRVSNNPTTSYWTDSSSYCIFDSSFNVTFNANAYMVTVGWGTQCYALTSDSAAEYPYEIIVELNGNSSIDVSCRASKDGSHIYLSSGRVDVPGSYVSAVFDATTKFTDEDITNPTDIDVANEGEIRERYKKLKITEPRTVSFETTITGTAASNYYVDRFVVYHIETERYEIVTPNPMGNNKYQGSVYVESDCYIVPIYFVTEAYATENNLAQIDIYFDRTAINDKAWGPFVACYAWGTNNAEYFGGWSAQLMIPSEDGTSFYTMVTVPAKGNTAAGNVPNGVTFNNYTQSTVPGSNPGAFGISATQYQCYDYREPITLYESGYEVITFVAKDSTDGYHGDRANGVTANTVTSSTTDIFNKYDFDYLYCRDGVTPMDLNGDAIESGYADLENGQKADYYIINKGDITYDPNGTKYVGDNNFDADWAVDWYIFDKDGKFLKNILSTAMWHDKTDSFEDGLYTYLHDALGVTAEQVAGKTVAISYEHENNAGHQVSYDGQWYGNMLDHKVVADVKVGEIDGSNFIIDDDNINETYGEGYVIDVEGDGGKYQSVEISLDLGEVSLSANTTTNGYYFVGWYTYANGKYTQIGKSLDYTTYIDNNKTYYAMFRKVGNDQVVINHMVYSNPNDPDIPSHGGKSTMWVEIYQGDTLISKSTPNTSSSTAIIDNAVNETTYTVKVCTTPLMNGEFFAWYTDSIKADGTKTYEEILTEETHKYSTTTVEATFEYTYDLSDDSLVKNINIYSDIKRVSNEATIKFNYYNRFGIRCTYTVKNVPLTDQECEGYDGNDYQEYVPTYYYELTLKDGQTVFAKPGTEGDYDIAESKNNLHQYIPNETVTDAFNDEIKWVLDEKSIKVEKSLIEIWADQDPPEYTVNYTMGSESGNKTGEYNTLMSIDAPATFGGNKFSYWWEPATEEILCYTTYYNYRIVENKTIEAVYGVDVTQPWTPSINSVTYTREYADDHDIVYTDYLLAYNNKDAAVLKEVPESEGIKFGLLVYRDANYYIEDSENINYPAAPASNAQLEDYLERTARDKQKNMAFTVEGTRYNCYYYNLTDKVDNLTVFNRIDYYLGYHNDFVVYTNTETKKDYYYHNYAFKAVSYIIVGDEVYLSKPKDVDFYDLGTELVNSNAGN